MLKTCNGCHYLSTMEAIEVVTGSHFRPSLISIAKLEPTIRMRSPKGLHSGRFQRHYTRVRVTERVKQSSLLRTELTTLTSFMVETQRNDAFKCF
jgi:hypothetical protein